MIPTYNRPELLVKTLESVLTQAPSSEEMQIEVVDDCSRSREIHEIVTRVGKGRVGYHRLNRRHGTVGVQNIAVRRARGVLVHILHDDDCVLSGFYSRMAEVMHNDINLGASFCNYIEIDVRGQTVPTAFPLDIGPGGRLVEWHNAMSKGNVVRCPGAIVVRREVFEKLGGFRPVAVTEDYEMWLRVFANYPVYYVDTPLIAARVHRDTTTHRAVDNGQNLTATWKAFKIAKQSMPTLEDKAFCERKMNDWREYIIHELKASYLAGDYRRTSRLLAAALGCCRNFTEATNLIICCLKGSLVSETRNA